MAILGAGTIANKMAATITRMETVEAYAIAARDLDRAQSFAAKYGIEKAYGSYEQMLADDAVDLVYIAVPHSHHNQFARQCLEAEKHVLCEKPFMVNEKQAREIYELAESRHLLAAEAMWTRYMGIRPEAWAVGGSIAATIGEVELRGQDQVVTFCLGQTPVRAILNADEAVRAGCELGLSLHANRCHFFDPETEKRL